MTDRWYLRRVGSYQHQRTILHLDVNEVTINRSRTATHTFQCSFISRKHAVMRNVNGEWFLLDNGASNGTFLNADKIAPHREYSLVENDIIGFGMPLCQQNEEDSVVYRLCKEQVTKPSTSNGRSSDTESQGSEKACMMVVPNNHLVIKNSVRALQVKKEINEDADQTIVRPDHGISCVGLGSPKPVSALPVLVIKKEITSPNETLPECQVVLPQVTNCDLTIKPCESAKQQPDGVKLQNDEEIICIDLDDSEDEAPLPVKQATEPPTTNSSCDLPFAKSCEAAFIDAFVGDDIIDLSDDDDDGHHLDNSLKANDRTNSCDTETRVKSTDNAHTNVHDRQQVPESSRDEVVKKIESLGTCDDKSGGMQQVRECASHKLFSECSVLNSTNKYSKNNEARPTDTDVMSIVQPTTNDVPGVSNETTKVPSEQASESENDLYDGIGYSQEDELITISDDEDYISQKNCQVENNAAPFTVKQEEVEDPLSDLEENNDWNNMFHERLMKDIANEYAAETSKSTVETLKTNAQTSKVSDPEGIPMEIDDNLTLSEPSVVSEKVAASEPLPGPSGVSTTASDNTGEDPMEANDFFPELSQKFYDGEVPSDSEEDEMQTDRSSVDRRPANNRLSLNKNATLTSPKKPVAVNSFYSLGSIGTYDRLKNKQGQLRPGSTMMTRALPNFRGRRSIPCNSVPLQKPSATTYKQKSNAKGKSFTAKGKSSTAMKDGLRKDFIKDRVRMPGGGTDIRTGLRSPTKKPGFHVLADNDKLPKFPNGVIKSSSTGKVNAQRASSSNVPNGRNTSNDSSELLQGVTQERRPPTVRSRESKSRSEQLAEAMLESTTHPSKRKALPLHTAKLPPKKQAIERPVAASRNNKGKDLPKTPKATILLPLPVSNNKHPPPLMPTRPSVPLNTSSNSNTSELNIKNKKSNKRISFSENPPEVRYYQPDTHSVEEQIQHQNEIAFMAGPQRPEVIAASERILSIILSWKSAWLHEQETIQHPPPVVNSKDIKVAVSMYSSHAEYVKVYEPLLLLETWEGITRDWRTRRDSCPVIQLILGTIRQDSGESPSRSMYFHCYAVFNEVDEEKGRLPQDGWISILEVPVSNETPRAKVDGAGRSYSRLFAYVQSCKKSTVNYLQKDEPFSPLLKEMISKHKDKKVVMKLVLQTRYASLSISDNRPLNLKMAAYLKPHLRIFQALHFLPFSLLGPGILKPDKDLCLLSSGRSLKELVNIDTIHYNQIQRSIILKTTETVSPPNTSPKICLIQGPPGTGKSTLVVGLILQLLFGTQIKGKAKPRILLCAPSNGAIDEILHRLLEIRKSLTSSQQKLRMIRVGFKDSIQPRVRAYSLDNIVRSNIGNQKTMLEKEINDLTTTLNGLRQKLDTKILRNGKRSEINKMKMDFDLIDNKLYMFKQKLDEWNHQSPDERQHNYCVWREECLKNADIIATTLGSCTQHGMEIFLRNNSHPFVCIIDEATQSIEQETLLPLQFCVSKLILIGDPKQLPATVLSVKARDSNLNQSLFERFFHYFGNSHRNPIVMLDVQYRMHPELCFYPSKAFYKNKLRTDGEIEQKYANFPTVPYAFFDIRDSKETSTGKGDLTNPNEAIFIVKLCEALLKLTSEQSCSLGVITFYQYQKQLINKQLAASSTIQELVKTESIEVNTVDSFQGREKDIIIVSSVRANSSNGGIGFINQAKRLNVAITRAKRSLFICGHRESLMVSHHWKGLIDDANFRKKVEKVASLIPLTALQNLVTRPFH